MAASTNRSRSARLVTSACTTSASPPASRSRCSVAASRSGSRPQTPTRDPSSASRSASAAPSPSVPPVISTTFPVRCKSIGLLWPSAELLDREMRGGYPGLGQQPGCGGLVRGNREGAAAADGGAVAPRCSGQVDGPGAVCAQATALPSHRGSPAGPRLVEKTVHAAFGVSFPLAGRARGGDLDELMPRRGKGGVGDAVASGVDPVIRVHHPEPARAGVGTQAQVERCHAGTGPGQRPVTGKLARRGEAGRQDRLTRGQSGYPCPCVYPHSDAGSPVGEKTDQSGPCADHVPRAAGQRPPKALAGERGKAGRGRGRRWR